MVGDFKKLLRNPQGFTFIDLVLVILLVGILMVSAEAIGPVGGGELYTAARKVRMDILYARHLAMLTNVNHGVQFTNGVGYQVYQGNPGTPIIDAFDKTAFNEDFSRYGNVQVGNDFQVEFDAIGRPIIGGGGQVQIADGGGVVTLTITTSTGSVVGL